MKTIFTLLTLFTTTLCIGQKCGDKIVGIHNRSTTAIESKSNGVFQFQMVPDKKTFVIDSSWTFQIKDAWVENTWTYKCVNDRPVIDKEKFVQLVVEPLTKQIEPRFDYLLSLEGTGGTFLSSKPPIEFKYQGGDTLVLLLKKFNQPMIDTTTTLVARIKFTKVGR